MEKNQFNYTYKAPTEEERKEIDSIRRQYQSEEKGISKIDRLRKLDAYVKNSAVIASLIFGIVGCLIFGLGFAMVLEWNMVLLGVVSGVVGIALMIPAYPIYCSVYKKNKEKYRAEILQLSEELLNETSSNKQE